MRRELRSTTLLLTTLVLGAVALLPSAAHAADVRLASPTSVDTTGTCLITACRLDRALAVANPGDDIALEAGVPYSIGYEARATSAVNIRPAVPGTQPRLVGTAGLASPTLKLAAGGTVTGLRVETSAGQAALHLADGARGVGLELLAGSASNAHAARLESAPAATALISSFARTASGYTAVEIVDPTSGTPGGASLVNVTAIATGNSSWGVTTDLATQSPVVKNSIVRAPSKNFHARAGSTNSQPILVSNSNFVVGTSSGWTDAGGNQKSVTVPWTDEAAGNYRPLATSPTIDAGAADGLITATVDPDGDARSLGSAPDMGAYEYDPTPPSTGGGSPDPDDAPPADTGDGDTTGDTTTGETTTGGTTSGGTTTTTATADPRAAATTYQVTVDGTPILPTAAAPVLGQTVTVDTSGGKPLIRLPGSTRFVALTDAASIPVGSTVDVTKSRIKLTSVRDGEGHTQTGEFWGGRFIVRQPRSAGSPYTDLVLTGSNFAGCPKRSLPVRASAAAGRKRKPKTVVRSLWGRDDRGRFRTRGQNSVATVRGTVWLVQDRCDGTLTRVTKGAVEVRENRGGRKVLLRAGRSHLARRR